MSSTKANLDVIQNGLSGILQQALQQTFLQAFLFY
jgi:hypothetical protein